MTSQHKRAVGIFNSRSDVESALQDLKNSNYAMDKVSVIAQESAQGEDIAGVEVRENVGNKADEGAVTGAVAGGAIGGITGLLVGLGMLAIPGIGSIMFAGAEATAIATTLAGALVSLGIPEERAKVYHHHVSKGSYLVIVNGTEAQINHAQEILSSRGIQEWGIYDIPTSPADETQPKVLGEYKYIVGVFRMRHDLKYAITAIGETHFPMTQMYIVKKNPLLFSSINSIDVKDRLENYAGLGMSEERARHYEQLLERGNYLIILSGTNEQINEAKSVLEDQSVEDLSIHDPSVISVNS